MENNNSILFDGRYQLEPIQEDWDTGRSGQTRLAFDIKLQRRVVLKMADPTMPDSEKLVRSLENEEEALKLLFSTNGVPELIKKKRIKYGAKATVYLVLEYIDASRVENNLQDLSLLDRCLIISQLFLILHQAHQQGIANGDIDLKHLFWKEGQKRLTIIDWGNALFSADRELNDIYSFDLARSAEIIYALTTNNIPSAIGPLDLPMDGLLTDLFPLPESFYALCRWAPRGPVEGSVAPFSAFQLYKDAADWAKSVNRNYWNSEATTDTYIDDWISEWVTISTANILHEKSGILIQDSFIRFPRRSIISLANFSLSQAQIDRRKLQLQLDFSLACNVREWKHAKEIINTLDFEQFATGPELLVFLNLLDGLINSTEDSYPPSFPLGIEALKHAFSLLIKNKYPNEQYSNTHEEFLSVIVIASYCIFRDLFKSINIETISFNQRIEIISGIIHGRIQGLENKIDTMSGDIKQSLLNNTILPGKGTITVLDSWKKGGVHVLDKTPAELIKEYKTLRTISENCRKLFSSDEVLIKHIAILTSDTNRILELLESVKDLDPDYELEKTEDVYRQLWQIDQFCISSYQIWRNAISNYCIGKIDYFPELLQEDCFLTWNFLEEVLEQVDSIESVDEINVILLSVQTKLNVPWTVLPQILEFIYMIDLYGRALRKEKIKSKAVLPDLHSLALSLPQSKALRDKIEKSIGGHIKYPVTTTHEDNVPQSFNKQPEMVSPAGLPAKPIEENHLIANEKDALGRMQDTDKDRNIRIFITLFAVASLCLFAFLSFLGNRDYFLRNSARTPENVLNTPSATTSIISTKPLSTITETLTLIPTQSIAPSLTSTVIVEPLDMSTTTLPPTVIEYIETGVDIKTSPLLFSLYSSFNCQFPDCSILSDDNFFQTLNDTSELPMQYKKGFYYDGSELNDGRGLLRFVSSQEIEFGSRNESPSIRLNLSRSLDYRLLAANAFEVEFAFVDRLDPYGANAEPSSVGLFWQDENGNIASFNIGFQSGELRIYQNNSGRVNEICNINNLVSQNQLYYYEPLQYWDKRAEYRIRFFTQIEDRKPHLYFSLGYGKQQVENLEYECPFLNYIELGQIKEIGLVGSGPFVHVVFHSMRVYGQ